MFRDKLSENSDEKIAEEISGLLKEVAQPVRVQDNKKSLIARAARLLALSESRARKLWYGEARAIRAAEADHIRERAELIRRQRERELDARLAAVSERIRQLELDL